MCLFLVDMDHARIMGAALESQFRFISWLIPAISNWEVLLQQCQLVLDALDKASIGTDRVIPSVIPIRAR